MLKGTLQGFFDKPTVFGSPSFLPATLDVSDLFHIVTQALSACALLLFMHRGGAAGLF